MEEKNVQHLVWQSISKPSLLLFLVLLWRRREGWGGPKEEEPDGCCTCCSCSKLEEEEEMDNMGFLASSSPALIGTDMAGLWASLSLDDELIYEMIHNIKEYILIIYAP